jgi:hypothetical protein
MSKSSSGGGIGIGTLIMIGFIFNIFFCDDDKTDVKEINVETKEIISNETKEEIKEGVHKVVSSAKKAFKELQEGVVKELNKKEEGEKIDKTQDKQPAEKEVVKRQEEKVETLGPMEEDKPEEEEFKRL